MALRYCSPDGTLDEGYNPNGSANAIAGLRNEAGNVLGMMPHPEHAVDPDLGPTGGQHILEWLLAAAGGGVGARKEHPPAVEIELCLGAECEFQVRHRGRGVPQLERALAAAIERP